MIILTDEEGKEIIEAFSEIERLAYLCGLQPRKARIMDIQELAHKMYKKLSEREALTKNFVHDLDVHDQTRKLFTHEMFNYMPTLPMGTDAAGMKDMNETNDFVQIFGVKFRKGIRR